ncbi:albumin-2-like [Vigna radiata var. radiata]|uniref:Albumin-2-like n=1 Tax=Vigna radiata var. radiata TaxID=3916 RepID=A0A1S3TET4_VIGRR|nr:albumin-2-like [Vigna radiata var. radiata]
MSNPPYINAAFRSSRDYEVYFFAKNKYVRLSYTPGGTDDKILTNLTLISSGFPSLGTKYVRIDYDSKQLVGSIRNIADGFPVLNGTIFESGIDACFASHKESEAYLFKGDKYVRIHFTPDETDDTLIGDVRPILDGWPVLRGIFPVS